MINEFLQKFVYSNSKPLFSPIVVRVIICVAEIIDTTFAIYTVEMFKIT